jgi:hypothetical protein
LLYPLEVPIAVDLHRFHSGYLKEYLPSKKLAMAVIRSNEFKRGRGSH